MMIDRSAASKYGLWTWVTWTIGNEWWRNDPSSCRRDSSEWMRVISRANFVHGYVAAEQSPTVSPGDYFDMRRDPVGS